MAAAAVRGATAAGAAGQHDPKASAKVGGEAVAAAGQRESKTSTIAEAFPTSLVVSKHFRDTSSGREILMLEVAKVSIVVLQWAGFGGFTLLTAKHLLFMREGGLSSMIKAVLHSLCNVTFFMGFFSRASTRPLPPLLLSRKCPE